MPTLVLLPGPNGAGKTTFINGLRREGAEAFRVVNPMLHANEDWRAGA
jgi:predicted ABC-type ATPase